MIIAKPMKQRRLINNFCGDENFYKNLSIYLAAFGDLFSLIGAREPQPKACDAFQTFGEAHRNMEKYGIHLLRICKPVSLKVVSSPRASLRGRPVVSSLQFTTSRWKVQRELKDR